MRKPRYLIGIDPGVKTGIAVWDRESKRFHEIKTLSILKAITFVQCFVYDVEIRFEDARKRKWFGHSGREKLQGAGSVKRDCAIWEELCHQMEAPFFPVAPQHNTTKMTAEQFRKLTGWSGRTSEHSRDAAMLVFGG